MWTLEDRKQSEEAGVGSSPLFQELTSQGPWPCALSELKAQAWISGRVWEGGFVFVGLSLLFLCLGRGRHPSPPPPPQGPGFTHFGSELSVVQANTIPVWLGRTWVLCFLSLPASSNGLEASAGGWGARLWLLTSGCLERAAQGPRHSWPAPKPWHRTW